MPPENLSCHRINARQTITCPTNQNILPSLLNKDWRRIACSVCQRTPYLFAIDPLKRHHAGPIRSGYLLDNEVAINQRRRCNTPDRHLDVVFRLQITFPNHGTRFGIQAMKVAHRTDRICVAVVNRNASAWASGVTDSIVRRILVFPN